MLLFAVLSVTINSFLSTGDFDLDFEDLRIKAELLYAKIEKIKQTWMSFIKTNY